MDVKFTPDGQTLASCSRDGTVKLWDVATGRERITLYGRFGGISWMMFSPDGRTLALCCRDSTIRLWRSATDEDVRARGW